MPQYRHVGTQLMYHQDGRLITVKSFGQPVELDEQLATELRRQNAPLLSSDQFQTLGFTDDELKRWASSLTWRNAPKDFLAKVEAAHELVRKNAQDAKAQVEALPPQPEPIPDTPPQPVNQEGQSNA
jgi:hypothetical protein